MSDVTPASAGGVSSSTAPNDLKRLSRFLDESIKLPGGFRIGWDGVIGLIPGIGDAAGLLASAYIVGRAARLGVAVSVLLRMCANVAIESTIGAIPLAGDLFDLAFKANSRNLALIEQHGYSPNRAGRHSTVWLLALSLALVSIALVTVYAIVLTVSVILALVFPTPG